MPATAAADAPPQEAFDLVESISLELVEGAVARGLVEKHPGTVPLHVIRPCVGRGKGRHVYSPEMLRENAGKFAGWKSYVDHRSEAALRAAAGLPRSVRDLAGRLLETKWDPTVPADPARGFEQGAVIGALRPVGIVRQLIDEDPGLLEASINARATSVRPVTRDGKRAWLVEGIENRGSVDFVTEGGAGGRVASALLEAYHDAADEEIALLETLTNDELLDHIREQRPQLLEALGKPEAGANGGAPDQGREGGDHPTGGEMTQTPAEVLREALATDEGREALDSHVNARLEEAMTEERERTREEAELARAEVRADADRAVQVRDLRDLAHRQIKEAKLPGAFEENLLEAFAIDAQGRPSPALNVFDEVDRETGQVTRPASDVLREAVTNGIKRQRDLIEAAGGGTRVRGQGAGGEEGKGEGGEEPPAGGDGEKPALWRQSLQEAGFEDPDEAYK